MKRIIVVCNGNIHRSVIAEMFIREKIIREGAADRFDVVSKNRNRPRARPALQAM